MHEGLTAFVFQKHVQYENEIHEDDAAVNDEIDDVDVCALEQQEPNDSEDDGTNANGTESEVVTKVAPRNGLEEMKWTDNEMKMMLKKVI